MRTTKERVTLATDTEEITAVKAPPPGLIRESKMMSVPGSGLLVIDVVEDTDQPTPPPVATAAPKPAATPARGSGRVTLPDARPDVRKPVTASYAGPPAPARTTWPGAYGAPPTAAAAPRPGSQTARRSTPVAVRMPAPVPIAATLVASFQRPVVDLVPVKPGARTLAYVAPDAAFLAPAPARSRAGLYGVLVALLVGGAGLVGWRQWSARPGRVEITTTPADAVISVGSEALADQSPALIERAPGTYEISVAREGYQHTHRTVQLGAGQDLELSVALTPVVPEAERPATAPAPPARPTPANPIAPRRPQVAGGGARSAPSARSSDARPDPGIAAMLAARSGPLRDLSPAARAAAAAPTGAAAEAEPSAATTSATPPTLSIETADEPAASPRPVAAAAPASDLARISTGQEIPGARTISSRVAKALLMIDPNAAEYRVALPPSLARADMKLAAVVKLCVSTEGKVASVKLLKSADPAVDAQIPAVLSKWRYRPLVVDNRTIPFCYTTQYEIADR